MVVRHVTERICGGISRHRTVVDGNVCLEREDEDEYNRALEQKS
jgi:hypothetical protein